MATRDDSPLGSLGLIPRFAPPPPATDSPPAASPTSSPTSAPPAAGPSPRPDAPAATAAPTATYSAGTDKPKDPPPTVKPATLIGQALELVMMMAGLALLRLARRELRQPTSPQVKAFAEPAARILGRHADLSALSPDLVDGISAGYAVVDYATDGPIVGPGGPRVRHLGEVDQADESDGRVVVSGPPDLPPPAPSPGVPRIAWDLDGNVVPLPPADAAQVTYAS
jgi:hypothetical protein